MLRPRITILLILAVILLIAGTGFSAQPASAAYCTEWHVVKRGESLYTIARRYGVSYQDLVELNKLRSPRRIASGQRLCITMGSKPSAPSHSKTAKWDFKVMDVVADKSVTIRTYNIPDNVYFDVHMGRSQSGWHNLIQVDRLDTGAGGSFNARFPIPAQLRGYSPLAIRLTQVKKNVSVQSVTIRTRNFPPKVNFDVLMGPIGTRAVNGYYVGHLYSGSGGTMTATYIILPALRGSYKIAIRTQNPPTGYYSYNWFYNNTTK
jgi:murein DD-endopeptidase MepM/ murein hydrolase activator NlpD